MSEPVPPPLPVLVDEDVWPEFHDAVLAVGDRWEAPSGRTYALALCGRRVEVALELDGLGPPPDPADIDRDLLALACLVHDSAGEPWSGDAVRQIAALWGWPTSD